MMIAIMIIIKIIITIIIIIIIIIMMMMMMMISIIIIMNNPTDDSRRVEYPAMVFVNRYGERKAVPRCFGNPIFSDSDKFLQAVKFVNFNNPAPFLSSMR